MTANEFDLERVDSLIASRQFEAADRLLAEINLDAGWRCLRSLLQHAAVFEALDRQLEAAESLQAAEGLSHDSRERARLLVRSADLRYLAGPHSFAVISSITDLLERSVTLDPSVGNVASRRKLWRILPGFR